VGSPPPDSGARDSHGSHPAGYLAARWNPPCCTGAYYIGAFLETEKVIGPGRSGEAVQAELHAFACSFGVELERSTDTYASLIHAALAGI
jgi:hypothetical protein